jgi:uncharacterized membrane protein
LPERIPVHWNFSGEVDRWGSGKVHAVFFSVLVIGMYLLFLFIPYLDPKKARYEQFSKTYHIFKSIIIFFLFLIYLIASLNGLGYNISVAFWVPVLIGILFIIIGNYMGKIKSNWFVGIRTPWTLSSEEVWNKTHRFGGKMFILAGLLIAFEGIMPANWRLPIFIIALVVILLGTLVYSYVVYLKEKKVVNKN